MQIRTLHRLPMLAKFLSVFIGLSLGSAVLAAEPPYVSLKTTAGEIVLELNQEKAPKNVANFLQYVKNGHYKNTIFHRVINDFMIQGGGMAVDMKQKPTGKPVQNESKNGLKNLAYSIAMARTEDPNSATAQFFINVVDNYNLDYTPLGGPGYTVFGRVVLGKEVVDKIKGVVTDDVRGMRDVPVIPITIKAVSVIKKPQAVIDAEASALAAAAAEAAVEAEKAAAAKPAQPEVKPETPKQ